MNNRNMIIAAAIAHAGHGATKLNDTTRQLSDYHRDYDECVEFDELSEEFHFYKYRAT